MAVEMDQHLRNCYQSLELQPGASVADARIAYMSKALQWHPDKHTTGKELAGRKFTEIHCAYHDVMRHLGHPLDDDDQQHLGGVPKVIPHSECPPSERPPSSHISQRITRRVTALEQPEVMSVKDLLATEHEYHDHEGTVAPISPSQKGSSPRSNPITPGTEQSAPLPIPPFLSWVDITVPPTEYRSSVTTSIAPTEQDRDRDYPKSITAPSVRSHKSKMSMAVSQEQRPPASENEKQESHRDSRASLRTAGESTVKDAPPSERGGDEIRYSRASDYSARSGHSHASDHSHASGHSYASGNSHASGHSHASGLSHADRHSHASGYSHASGQSQTRSQDPRVSSHRSRESQGRPAEMSREPSVHSRHSADPSRPGSVRESRASGTRSHHYHSSHHRESSSPSFVTPSQTDSHTAVETPSRQHSPDRHPSSHHSSREHYPPRSSRTETPPSQHESAVRPSGSHTSSADHRDRSRGIPAGGDAAERSYSSSRYRDRHSDTSGRGPPPMNRTPSSSSSMARPVPVPVNATALHYPESRAPTTGGPPPVLPPGHHNHNHHHHHHHHHHHQQHQKEYHEHQPGRNRYRNNDRDGSRRSPGTQQQHQRRDRPRRRSDSVGSADSQNSWDLCESGGEYPMLTRKNGPAKLRKSMIGTDVGSSHYQYQRSTAPRRKGRRRSEITTTTVMMTENQQQQDDESEDDDEEQDVPIPVQLAKPNPLMQAGKQFVSRLQNLAWPKRRLYSIPPTEVDHAAESVREEDLQRGFSAVPSSARTPSTSGVDRAPLVPRREDHRWLYPVPLSLEDIFHGVHRAFYVFKTAEYHPPLSTQDKLGHRIVVGVPRGAGHNTILTVSTPDGYEDDPDLHFVIDERPHGRFIRQGDDLIMGVRFPNGSVRGSGMEEMSVEGIDGKKYTVYASPQASHGWVKFPQAGMPASNGGRGQLLVRWELALSD